MKILDWIVDVVLSIIVFERPDLHEVVAIKMEDNKSIYLLDRISGR